MAEHIHIVVPCYYTQHFKTKEPKTFLVNLNWYRNAYHFVQNEVKQWYNTMIIQQLQAQKAVPIKGHYEVAIVYHYKNVVTDLDNVAAMGNKALNDAAQAYGLVENDNVKFCKKSAYYVGEHDKENPRLEMFIRAYQKDDKDHTDETN